MIAIRPEMPGDTAAIQAVHRSAFETHTEATLVDELRSGGWVRAGVSLVAVDGDSVVGHVLVTPGAIERTDGVSMTALALGPIGVVEPRQRTGIGTQLMHAVLARTRARSEPGVFLVGHPSYYPRFGFVPASLFSISYPGEVSSDVWMARERLPGSLASVGPGVFRFAPPFDSV